ncbi:hypothetical protein CVT25_011661 [Psilocybe cyanescens]|uniref:Uncharacterized protein n=1 Tax=Psilocybe cyanescens TaxID=93625 RepID=A0A409XWI2_PSICY|nr:hypothetical protein CVT25_011661 [Psilocybe cyanescens]
MDHRQEKRCITITHPCRTCARYFHANLSIIATDATFYPVVTVVDAEEKPTDKVIAAEAPDHFIIIGFLKSSVLANLFCRGGFEGEEGTIRIESNGNRNTFPSVVEPDLYLNEKKVEFEVPGSVLESLGIAWKEFAGGGAGGYTTRGRA